VFVTGGANSIRQPDPPPWEKKKPEEEKKDILGRNKENLKDKE